MAYMDNKPPYMSDGDWIIKNMANERKDIPYSSMKAIVNFQFDEANKALKIHQSIELSGFGKFVYSTRRAELKFNTLMETLKKYNNIITNPESSALIKRNALRKITKVVEDIRILETKAIRNHERKTDY